VDNGSIVLAYGAVHELLREKGRQAALEGGELDRMEVETAAAYLADEDTAVGFLYSACAAERNRKVA
jgi:hypothetical protein